MSTRWNRSCPSLVTKLPTAPLKVVAMPSFGAADQVPADYQPGTPDGSRPGEIRVNTTDATKRLLPQVEAIAYHEGVPGHHLQISLAQEQTGIPEFRRFEMYTAFVEGWAFYSEQLGKEVGFYQDPYSEYGRLENRNVARRSPGRRHWRSFQTLDARTNGAILPRPHCNGRHYHSGRSRIATSRGRDRRSRTTWAN